MQHRLSLERIAAARAAIDPVFLDTPQYRSEALEAMLGCRLIVKIETLNPIRSFKGRGAMLATANIAASETIVCASAGNFGQAMAYACRARNMRLIVYASVNASPLKIERMRAFGAEVRLHGTDFDAAKAEAKRIAAAEGLRMVEDSLEAATGEGAATIGPELLRWPTPLDAVVIALGNGALLTGVGRWIKTYSPQTQVIGVVAAGAPSMEDSWRANHMIEYASVDTIADGIAVRVPIPEAVADMHGTVDDVLRVRDESLIAAMQHIHQHLGLVSEPSGAVGIAAVLENRERFVGQTVATIICGGNLTPEQMRQWL